MFTTHYLDYHITCHTQAEYRELKHELLTQNSYYLELDAQQPIIVDAGAHIGLTTLYFKHLFPNASILAIEPHPVSFALLEQNCADNFLQNVTLAQTALVGKFQGKNATTTLYADPANEWLMSASLQQGAWNHRQANMQPLTVPATTLSSLIHAWPAFHGLIDLVKLDIEGTENLVIADLLQSGLIHNINHFMVEAHLQSGKEWTALAERLTKVGFFPKDEPDRKLLQSKEPVLFLAHFSR